MAFNAGAAAGYIQLDAKQFLAEVNKVQGANKGMTGSFLKAQIAFAAIQQGFRVLTGFVKDSVTAFNKQAQVEAQLNQVLKSTGHAAGITADEVKKMAAGFQQVTKFGDEAVLGAENVLLTFTKIGKDVFPDATEIVLDMSTALGQDLKSSAIQVGKALQDPVLGATALRRVGVNLSKSQADLIKQLVNTGRAAEAQALILKELQTEFGGSARAAGETFAGALARLQNNFGDVQEDIGALITSGMQPFVQMANEMVKGISDFLNSAEGIKTVTTVLKGVGAVFITVQNIAKAAFNTLSEIGKSFADLFDFGESTKGMAVFNMVLSNVTAAVAVLFEVGKKLIDSVFKAIKPVIDEIVTVFSDLFGDVKEGNIVFDVLGGVIQVVSSGFAILGKFIKLVFNSIVDTVDIIKSNVNLILKFGAALTDPFNEQKRREAAEALDSLGKSYIKFAENSINNTKDLVETTVNEIKNAGAKAKQTASDLEQVYKQSAESSAAGIKTLQDQQQQYIDNLKKNAEDVGGIVQQQEENAKSAARTFKESWSQTFDTLKDNLSESAKAFGSFSNQAQQDFSALFAHIQSGIEGITSGFMMGFGAIDGALSQYYTNQETSIGNWYAKSKEAIEKNVTDEKERTAQLEALEKDYSKKQAEIKKKRFQQEKTASLIQSIINTAVGFTKALAQGGIFGAILGAVVLAAGAAQTALIASQPIPQFYTGGVGSGQMIVGERGPEIINLGTTSRILSNDESQKALSDINGPAKIEFNDVTISRETDIDRMLAIAGAQLRAQRRGA
jgi:hypothetical protein